MKTRWMIMAGMIGLCGMAQASFVTIGNAGNAADGTTGYGAVGYNYQISATEVTIAEFTASGAGNGDENFWDAGSITGAEAGPTAPAVNVTLYEAMQYCNWLTSGNINNGAYQFVTGVYQSTDRASAVTTYGTVYALPTEDEWYKAAYFKPNASGYSLYANGTGNAPSGTEANYDANGNWTAWTVGSGLQEQNGMFDMMGNVWEWMEASGGVLRGGSCYGGEADLSSWGHYDFGHPEYEDINIGFRVVAVNVVPEPASALLIGCGGLLVVGYRRFFGRI